MDKSWLIVIPLVLLMLLLIPSMIIPNETPMTANTEDTETAEFDLTTESISGTMTLEQTDPTQPAEMFQPNESTAPTDSNGFIDGNAGCGEAMAFSEKYDEIKPPISETRRIAVIVDGVLGHEDIERERNDCKVDIQTGEGVHINRINGLYYIPVSDSVIRRVGTTYVAGNEALKYFFVDDDYVFTLELELLDITVQYIDMKYANVTPVDLDSYFEKELFFDLQNVTAVRLEVSDCDTKEVRCFVIGPEGETEVFPSEQP